MKPDTLRGVLVQNFRLRSRLVADGLVPRRWRHWLRHLLAHELGAAQARWHQSPTNTDLANVLAIDPPRSRAQWMYLARIVYGGV